MRGFRQFSTIMRPSAALGRLGIAPAKVDMRPVRVRFAPSPTGSLHIGGARTALFNWLLAKRTKGKFVLRIEDTDESRSTRASEISIINDLTWLGLQWDEGPDVDGPYAPYRQSDRKHIYLQCAHKLIAEGKAYPCFCTEEELEAKKAAGVASDGTNSFVKYDGTWRDANPDEVGRRLANNEPHTIRFKVPQDKSVVFIDDAVRGRVEWGPTLLSDFIIVRSSGVPVYNFCVAIDDALMQISHVIRAEEHLSNTLRQILVFEALGWPQPSYAHCSLILGPDKAKLSKRHGAASVQQFAEQGFLPSAMINYLALLGWNEGGTAREVYSATELGQVFDLSRVCKSPAIFDMKKLMWLNGQHIRLLSAADMQCIVKQQLTDLLVKTTSATTSNNSSTSHSSSSSKKKCADEQEQRVQLFISAAAAVVQRDAELVTDCKPLVLACLRYDLLRTLATDAAAQQLVSSPSPSTSTDSSSSSSQSSSQSSSFHVIAAAVTRDFNSGTFPSINHIMKQSNHDGNVDILKEFDVQWKAYVAALSQELGLKGKHLFHPLRLILTGRMQGPELNFQMRLLSLTNEDNNSNGDDHVNNKACALFEIPSHVNLKSRMNILQMMLTNKTTVAKTVF